MNRFGAREFAHVVDVLLTLVAKARAAVAVHRIPRNWARDRDCLWNIAKKPKIYDNAFLWPKIWQGNRDMVKNPDVIQPGWKLKIPAKADLTREERSALKSYWTKKQSSKPAGSN